MPATRSLHRLVSEALARLRSQPLADGEFDRLAGELLAADEGPQVARRMIRSFGATVLPVPDFEATCVIARVLAFAMQACGRDTALAAVRAEVDIRRGPLPPAMWVLARMAGLEPRADDAAGGPVFGDRVAGLARVARREPFGPWEAAERLPGLAGVAEEQAALALLARVASEPAAAQVAAQIALGASAPATRAAAIGWVGRRYGMGALPLLERLAERDVGRFAATAAGEEAIRMRIRGGRAARTPAWRLPFEWPVVAAYTSRVAAGTWIYVLRERCDRREALLGTLVTERRGIIDATGHPGADPDASDAFFDRVAASPCGLSEISPAAALRAIHGAAERTAATGAPVPYEFAVWRHLLAGLPRGESIAWLPYGQAADLRAPMG